MSPRAIAALPAAAGAVAFAAAVVHSEYDSDNLLDLAWLAIVPLAATGVVWWGNRLRPSGGGAVLGPA